jgi:hypothetical protein
VFGVWDMGFWVWGLGFGYGVWGLAEEAVGGAVALGVGRCDSGFRVQGSGIGFRV